EVLEPAAAGIFKTAAGGIAADGAVGQRESAVAVEAAAIGGGVAADGAAGQHGRAAGAGIHAAAKNAAGGVVDGGVGQRERASHVGQAAAVAGGRVAGHGAVADRECAEVEDGATSTVIGGGSAGVVGHAVAVDDVQVL